MGFEETHNDLWDVGLKDDRFAMIARLDEEAKVVVKTPVGTTEEFELYRKVMQGTVLILSSVQTVLPMMKDFITVKVLWR